MSEKFIKTRVTQKHDTESNWLKTSFVPNQGELIIYDIEENVSSYERIKIGDGIHNINELPFVTDIEIPQSDWQQNDPSAPDYIKNRLAYIDSKTLTYDGNLDEYFGKYDMPDDVGGFQYAVKLLDTPIDLYSVTKVQIMMADGSSEMFELSEDNSRIESSEDIDGTASILYISHQGMELPVLYASDLFGTLVSYYESIYGGITCWTSYIEYEIVHQIDQKLIPESIATDEEVVELVDSHNTDTSAHNDIRSLIDAIVVPTKVSELTNDKGYLTSFTESDPTVPAWAKAAKKPSYTKSEVGLGNVDNVKQYSKNNPPVVVQAEEPTDTSVIWVDPNDEYVDEFSEAVNMALAQAKASGEFNPVKGVDYWTEADQEDIVQQVIAALGTPVFGRVDANKNITLTVGTLSDGVYTLWLEDENGKTTKLCTYAHETDAEVTYTNWIPLSTEVDGVTLYNGGLGYKENTRWSASGGGDITDKGRYTCGYIPVAYGDVIRLENIRMNKNDVDSGIANACTVPVFTALGTGSAVNASDLTNHWNAVWDDDGNLKQFTITNETTKYIRLNTTYIGGDSILTINEEIPDTEPSYTNQIPLSIDADGTPYNGGQGWKTGYRLNSSGAETAVADWEVTGYIPITTQDVLYFKNVQWRGNSQKHDYISLCNSDFGCLTSTQVISVFIEQTLKNAGSAPEDYGITVDADNNVVSIDFKKLSTTAYGSVSVNGWAAVKYIRFSCFGITEDSIITKNEPITD